MSYIFAHGGGGGRPMTPTECLIASVVMLLLGGFFLLSALHPKCRHWIQPSRRAHGRSIPLCVRFTIGLNFLLWAIALLGHAAASEFIGRYTGCILAFGIVICFASVLLAIGQHEGE